MDLIQETNAILEFLKTKKEIQCIDENKLKDYLEKVLKKLEVLELFKQTHTSFLNVLKHCNDYEDYLSYSEFKKLLGCPLEKELTQEEFNLVMEWLGEK